MGRDTATAAASVRFSFGRMNTEEDVKRVVVVLKDIIARMKTN
jgi:cysteine sulfinate desulfinase/cysteine desulfurase-like protein